MAAMKPRHAAALALVGWYLMVPPFSAKDVLYNTPLSRWQPVEKYSTLAECEEGKQTAVREFAAFLDADMVPKSFKMKALQAGKCIASDDPRLKGK